MGAEFAGKGVNVSLGPTTNLVRDPRWGRTYETYGEDPYLAGQITSAEVEGLQSQDVMAMVKHAAAYDQEQYPNGSNNETVSQQALEELYLAPFQTAIEQAAPGLGDVLLRRGQRRRLLPERRHAAGRPRQAGELRRLHHLRLGRATTTTSPSIEGGMAVGDAVPRAIASDVSAALAAGTLSQYDGERGRRPDPDPDVRLRHVRQPADRLPVRHRDQRGAPADRAATRRGGHGAAEEQRHPAAQPERHRVHRGDRHRRRRRGGARRRRQRHGRPARTRSGRSPASRTRSGRTSRSPTPQGDDNGTTDIPQAVAAAKAATDAIIYVNLPEGEETDLTTARPVQHRRDDDRGRGRGEPEHHRGDQQRRRRSSCRGSTRWPGCSRTGTAGRRPARRRPR